MKYALIVLLVLAVGMLLFNLTQVNWEQPLVGDSSIAVIGIIASASAVILLLILRVSLKINQKLKR